MIKENRNGFKHIFLSVTLFIMFIMPSACQAKQPTAIVIEEETGKPIEGAVAICIWRRGELSLNGIFEGGFEVVSKIIEVKSDKEGKIFIPGYWNWHLFKADYPNLNVYKFGYVCWDQRSIFLGGQRKDFCKNSRLVKLRKWPKKFSFSRHTSFIDSCTKLDYSKAPQKIFLKSLSQELSFARKEIDENINGKNVIEGE